MATPALDRGPEHGKHRDKGSSEPESEGASTLKWCWGTLIPLSAKAKIGASCQWGGSSGRILLGWIRYRVILWSMGLLVRTQSVDSGSASISTTASDFLPSSPLHDRVLCYLLYKTQLHPSSLPDPLAAIRKRADCLVVSLC